MKWSKGVAHLAAIARECGQLNERLAAFDIPVRLVGLWAYGPVLDGPGAWPDGREHAEAALALDVEPSRVPWYARPGDLEHATGLMGWGKRPVVMMFRSAARPVWNHHITRPLRLWDADAGVDEAAIEALESGDTEDLRGPGPSPEALREQLEHERQAAYAAMVASTRSYDDHRWTRGPLRPYAEPMWEAAAGYVDITEALERL